MVAIEVHRGNDRPQSQDGAQDAEERQKNLGEDAEEEKPPKNEDKPPTRNCNGLISGGGADPAEPGCLWLAVGAIEA